MDWKILNLAILFRLERLADITNKQQQIQVLKAAKKLERYGSDMTLKEVAPPGMEDLVLKLKKKYGKDSESPYKIAWAQYNKKHGKK